jgi:Tfp pilus assembly protein PilO
MTGNINLAKYKSFLTFIILLLFVVISVLNFIRPKVGEIFQIRGKINNEKRKLAELTQKESYLNNLDEFELNQKTQVVLKAIPAEKDIITPFSIFKILASQFNLEIQGVDINLGDDSLKNDVGSFSFFLKVKGTFEQLVNFIEKMKKIFPIMSIKEVDVEIKKDNSLLAKILIETYYSPFPEKIGSVESPILLVTSQEEKIYQEISGFSSILPETEEIDIKMGKENPFAF